MKRDKDLFREILLVLEADEGDPRAHKHIQITGKSFQEISYHVGLLTEAGFVVADKADSYAGMERLPIRLTYLGHEFLDEVRDPEAWRFVKTKAKEAGVASVKMLWEIAIAYGKQKLSHHLHLP